MTPSLSASFDQRIFAALRGCESPLLTDVVRVATHVGDGWTLTAIAVAVALAHWRDRPGAARYVAFVGIGAGLATRAIKLLVGRARPEGALRLAAASGPSFPSGHALASAAVFFAVAIVLAERWPRWRASLLVAAVVLSAVAGLSRVYLGVHYASDVVAGWCLGAAGAFGARRWFVERRASS